jgi:L-asparaginase
LQVNRQKIVVLGTGGTIAGEAASADDVTGYTAAVRGVQTLLASVPGLAQFPFELHAEQVAQIDSKDMDTLIWQRLLLRSAHWLAQPEVQGLVITHGTDTLEETAFLLHAVLAPSKPVVLTCAMRPATAADADGPQNLKDALTVVAHPDAQGVMVVCAGNIHSAQAVQKVHPTRLDAFSSGDAGLVGRVQDEQTFLEGNWPVVQWQYPQAAIEKIAKMTLWPRVEIVLSHAAAQGETVDVLVAPDVAQRFGAPAVQGLVVAATGNGTLHHALEAALLRAQAAGVSVVIASRCLEGSVVTKPGAVFQHSQGLSPVKARLALMLELMRKT